MILENSIDFTLGAITPSGPFCTHTGFLIPSRLEAAGRGRIAKLEMHGSLMSS